MKTPTLIEALTDAIELLNDIDRGLDVTKMNLYRRLTAMERARDAHHEVQMKAEQARKAIRELGRDVRSAGYTGPAPRGALNVHDAAA